jgi:hypothetical protein
MGVDFTGYSHVKTEPVPKKFRSKLLKKTEQEISEIKNLIKNSSPEQLAIIALFGISYGISYNNLNITYSFEISDELKEEFYKTIGKEPDFIYVDWHTNIIYRKTEDTQITVCGRSYSGYNDFRNLLLSLSTGHFYMPPDNDYGPENGIVSTDRCIDCLGGLDRVKTYLVSESFDGNCEQPDSIIKDCDNIHEESCFFREFYCMMTVASQGGIVLIH